MANFKRRRAKHQRAGCLMCAPHKDDRDANARDSQTLQEQRALDADAADWPMIHLDAYEAPDDGSDEYEAPFGRAFEDHDVVPAGFREPRGGRPSSNKPRKPFAIESRWVRAPSSWRSSEWHVCRRYAMAAQRDQALARLMVTEARRPRGPDFEYRTKSPHDAASLLSGSGTGGPSERSCSSGPHDP